MSRTYNKGDVIYFCKTKDPWGELSNMSPFKIEMNDIIFKSSEALYQACRFPDNSILQKAIANEASPMMAKKVAHKYISDSRFDWMDVRIKIMRWVLRMKLLQNWEEFSKILLDTGEKPIVELSMKDDFWGAIPDGDRLIGQNILGRLLMEIRQILFTPPYDDLNTVCPPHIENFYINIKPVDFYGRSYNGLV